MPKEEVVAVPSGVTECSESLDSSHTNVLKFEENPDVYQEGNSPDIFIEMHSLHENLKKLTRKIEERFLIDTLRDEQISELSAELRKHKEDLLFRAMKPLINGIIDLMDDIGEVIKYRPENDNCCLILDKFKNQTLDVLGLIDITSYSSNNLNFDPKLHNVVSTEPTEDQSLDKVIYTSCQSGYMYYDKVIRKERVIMYRYTPSAVELNSDKQEDAAQDVKIIKKSKGE